MTGIEYILHEAQEPHLFVIRKQRREGPEKTTVMSAYYVLDGSIYQAPQLYSVIGSRAVSYCHQSRYVSIFVFLFFLSFSHPYLSRRLFTDMFSDHRNSRFHTSVVLVSLGKLTLSAWAGSHLVWRI